MIHIASVIGARPQIIKAAAISRAIKDKFPDKIRETIVHTGQHYDDNMSQVFIDELGIPKPDLNLDVRSARHGVQTSRMIEGIEDFLLDNRPDMLILYGDTNSTLAGSVAASKQHIPVAHVEAGLRSFNKSMPEEINRILCDHCSTLLFSPTKTGYSNLLREGFKPDNEPPYSIDKPGIFHCGDVMYDNSLYFSEIAEEKSDILNKLELEQGKYILATIHRDNNTDEPKRLSAIFTAMHKIAENNDLRIVIPLHPRTANLLEENLRKGLFQKIENSGNIHIIQPVSFLDMIKLEKNTRMVMTDSGGVQKEAYFFEKPCIILRSETEWKEIVENKTAIVTDVIEKNILDAYKHFTKQEGMIYPSIFGDGTAAEFICEEILKTAKQKK
ncbi:MAG: UDP-N-acetylglucosamine 2-epimerase (non-hydrolyzing) [Bacteroidales bacterium]|nr:UDP-N-acetylglucosamine 2-epimerase (non-hydrolyzing) [Bacteroidales bacterium]MCF8343412.1 UDP-N-acetylglucosamine 2-epimerase (non-hydrolyzing) [Bacteroidales bacterium]MCF8349852.1 UDP-N-acetylglucosamine 2-epimerase (non-hydrolyzing) [Bacteroidales bacterium]MCF8375552.1 UDP-N-acetylglucosamine 2-epimerase (non-hydrolyzing) [Bacteroidales bacterium]MCF8399951.1 UDP-N-acetylglucosamine 2-epimerase (non-hydrolyzing) [Bacteroidales bacterium]